MRRKIVGKPDRTGASRLSFTLSDPADYLGNRELAIPEEVLLIDCAQYRGYGLLHNLIFSAAIPSARILPSAFGMQTLLDACAR